MSKFFDKIKLSTLAPKKNELVLNPEDNALHYLNNGQEQIVAGGDIKSKDAIELSYGEFKKIYDKKELISGQYYIINDYTYVPGYNVNRKSAGKVFKILVHALTKEATELDAYIFMHNEYEPDNEKLCKIKYNVEPAFSEWEYYSNYSVYEDAVSEIVIDGEKVLVCRTYNGERRYCYIIGQESDGRYIVQCWRTHSKYAYNNLGRGYTYSLEPDSKIYPLYIENPGYLDILTIVESHPTYSDLRFYQELPTSLDSKCLLKCLYYDDLYIYIKKNSSSSSSSSLSLNSSTPFIFWFDVASNIPYSLGIPVNEDTLKFYKIEKNQYCGHRGVISYMEDMKGNKVNYDFKNMLFVKWDLGIQSFIYTFNNALDNNSDASSTTAYIEKNDMTSASCESPNIIDFLNGVIQVSNCKFNTYGFKLVLKYNIFYIFNTIFNWSLVNKTLTINRFVDITNKTISKASDNNYYYKSIEDIPNETNDWVKI